MNKVFATLLASIVLACASTARYPPVSETITVWETLTSKTTGISTYTTWSVSYAATVSTVTDSYTWLEDATRTFTNQAVNMREESAAHYSARALIFEVPLPPEAIPGEHIAKVNVRFHYRAPGNMTLEWISMSTWERMRVSSETLFWYSVIEKINIVEGTGSWYDWTYIDRNDTQLEYVYISDKGFPEILSVDVEQILEDAVTETRTYLKTTTFSTRITVPQTLEKTYTKTITYMTFETTVKTLTTSTKSVPTSTTTTVPPHTTTETTTTSATTRPLIDPLGLQLLGFTILLVALAAIIVIAVRRRRKPEIARVGPIE